MIEKVSFLCFSSGILNELTLFFVLFLFRADADSSDYPNLLFLMKCC